MNMKFKAMLLGLSVMTALSAFAQKPVYLDTGKPIEERVKDALNRMTLEEKVKMIHAQSKFSSAGVPRLGIPEVWATDGPHGIRPEVLWDEWDQAGNTLEYAFDFMEAAFYNSQEMVMFVSGINTDFYCVRFLETYECERYVRYNRDLLFEDVSQQIRRRIEEL